MSDSRQTRDIKPVPILSVDRAQIPASANTPELEIKLQVYPGELHLIYSRDRQRNSILADAMLGLAPVAHGKIHFLGNDWAELSGDAAFGQRRGVGRVQREGNWMETRSVMENLLLPLRHHTLIPEQQLRTSASDLAQRFGLPGLPMQLPGECATADLQRAACIRAFLGRPQLVVLEHPAVSGDRELIRPLMESIQQVRRRQGAIIWFTEHLSLMSDRGIPADRRYRIDSNQLLAWETAQ
ncbi:MAG: hypothetical protein KDI83_04050 [Gammaproteobacteria bacterium]|nr:hypothetical protein [Gammaproteobacteria bacterium]